LAFSPENHTLAASNAEGHVQLIDVTIRHKPDQLQTVAMSGRALAWSPDGETVAAAVRGGAARLFDRRTGATRAVLRCPVQDIRCLAFAPDGRTLAVVCLEEPFVRLWDRSERRWRSVAASHPSPIIAIAFSPDGRLASLDGDTVRFWDPATAAPRGSLTAGPNTRSLAFTSDGASLLTAGSTIQVWEVGGDERVIRKAAAVPAGATAVCLSVARDGRLVASGGEDGSVRLWTLTPDRTLTPDKAPLLRPPGNGAVRSLGFAPDAKTLLTGQGGRLELWDMASRRLCDTLDEPIASAAFSPHDDRFATVGGSEEVVRLWEPAEWRVTRPPEQSLEPVKSLAYSTDGRTLITGSKGPHRPVRHYGWWGILYDTSPLRGATESLRFWDTKTGQEECHDLPARQVMAAPHLVARSAAGQLFAAGGEDGSVFLWDWPAKKLRKRLFISDKARRYTKSYDVIRTWLFHKSHPEYLFNSEMIDALTFSPDGRWLAAAGNRGSFRVWQTEDGKECCHWQGDANGSAWLAFTPDGDGVAGSRGGQVCIWDARTGALRTTLGVETDSPVRCGVFAPAGDVLALGSKDGLIRLWDPRSGEVKRLPGGHQDRVTALAFSPGGKTLASAGWDRTIRLWSLRASREVAALEGHNGRINALAFSPDGRTLASGGEVGDARGEVLLWRRPSR
jgi:WD40 repeat protein